MPHPKRWKTATSQVDTRGVAGNDKGYISLSESSDDEDSEAAAEKLEFFASIVQAGIDQAR